MVAVPVLTAVTTPLLTVATDVLEDIQVTFLSVALDGSIVALSVDVFPTVKVNVDLLSETPTTTTSEEVFPSPLLGVFCSSLLVVVCGFSFTGTSSFPKTPTPTIIPVIATTTDVAIIIQVLTLTLFRTVTILLKKPFKFIVIPYLRFSPSAYLLFCFV